MKYTKLFLTIISLLSSVNIINADVIIRRKITPVVQRRIIVRRSAPKAVLYHLIKRKPQRVIRYRKIVRRPKTTTIIRPNPRARVAFLAGTALGLVSSL